MYFLLQSTYLVFVDFWGVGEWACDFFWSLSSDEWIWRKLQWRLIERVWADSNSEKMKQCLGNIRALSVHPCSSHTHCGSARLFSKLFDIWLIIFSAGVIFPNLLFLQKTKEYIVLKWSQFIYIPLQNIELNISGA